MCKKGPLKKRAPCATCCAHLGGCYSTRRAARYLCAEAHKSMCHKAPLVRISAGVRPRVPLLAMGCLLGGCYNNRQAARYWRIVAHALACLCAPLGTLSEGATVPTECALQARAGCSPLSSTTVPCVPTMHGVGKSTPTFSSLIFFMSHTFFTPILALSSPNFTLPKAFVRMSAN